MPSEEAYPAGIEDRCTGCMDCVAECPFDAIVVWQRTEISKTDSPS
jgi:NAD-dependent dihydropyrimidine dehydrogenase PreA subunit